MFTFFDILKLLVTVAGAIIGGSYGSSFGWTAAIAGALTGLIVGVLVGNLPRAAGYARMVYDLKRSSVTRLKERLPHEPLIAHFLIGELVSRGEPPEQFRDYAAELLRSPNALERECGKGVAHMWFQELLADSSSSTSVEKTDGE